MHTADAALPSAFQAQADGYASFAPPDRQTVRALSASATHDTLVAVTYTTAYVFDANLALRATIALPHEAIEPIVLPLAGGRYDVLAADRLWVIDAAAGKIVADVPLETPRTAFALDGSIAIDREAPARIEIVDASTARLIGSAAMTDRSFEYYTMVTSNDGRWATILTRRNPPDRDDVQIMDAATAPRMTPLTGITLPVIRAAIPAANQVLVVGKRARGDRMFGQVVGRDGAATAPFPIAVPGGIASHLVSDDGRFALLYFAYESEDGDERHTVVVDLSTATVVRVTDDGITSGIPWGPVLARGRAVASPRCKYVLAIDPADAKHDGRFETGSKCPTWSQLTWIGDRLAAIEDAKRVVAVELSAIR